MNGKILGVIAAVAALWLHPVLAQDGAELYATRCAACHEAPPADAAHPPPPRSELGTMTPNTIYNALTQGVMRMQATGLSNAHMQALAEFLSGKPLEQLTHEMTSNLCENNPPMRDPALGPQWNGWGGDPLNARAALDAGIDAANVSRLRLKWVFGLPGEDQPRAQPAVADGRLFVGSKAGALYSLDAKSGCTHWTYLPRNGIRSAISVGPMTLADGSAGFAVYFVDLRANVHAVNAQTGEELWVTRVEEHHGVCGTGSVTLHAGYLYVPAAGVVEETSSSGADYGCCTFRGSITKVDPNTGAVVWKTYMMDEPQQRGVSTEGVPLYGPSGAGIWSAPTIDAQRGLLYTATGNAYGDPAPETSDAVLALNLDTGAIVWVNQITPGDAFIGGCDNNDSPNCPKELGPDFDFSASPILATTSEGRDLLVIPQKSGMAYALDPENDGKLVWEYRVNAGSRSGGFWGMAVADGKAYVAAGGYSDPQSGGIHALDLATGQRAWFTGPQDLLCQSGAGCRATQSAAVTAIPGAVFSGAADGGMRVYSAESGDVLWTFDSNPQFDTINGVPAAGGSFDGPGPVVVDGMVYFMSGNCCIVGRPGNALFAFELAP
ncbi:MAG: PQQ-binding-like beta-propeller repeat protein [Gammaproteobacteria bacterium]